MALSSATRCAGSCDRFGAKRLRCLFLLRCVITGVSWHVVLFVLWVAILRDIGFGVDGHKKVVGMVLYVDNGSMDN